jgi:hypothetical protein
MDALALIDRHMARIYLLPSLDLDSPRSPSHETVVTACEVFLISRAILSRAFDLLAFGDGKVLFRKSLHSEIALSI